MRAAQPVQTWHGAIGPVDVDRTVAKQGDREPRDVIAKQVPDAIVLAKAAAVDDEDS